MALTPRIFPMATLLSASVWIVQDNQARAKAASPISIIRRRNK
jgi:hypothetical protein